jgi:hypothetical protein
LRPDEVIASSSSSVVRSTSLLDSSTLPLLTHPLGHDSSAVRPRSRPPTHYSADKLLRQPSVRSSRILPYPVVVNPAPLASPSPPKHRPRCFRASSPRPTEKGRCDLSHPILFLRFVACPTDGVLSTSTLERLAARWSSTRRRTDDTRRRRPLHLLCHLSRSRPRPLRRSVSRYNSLCCLIHHQQCFTSSTATSTSSSAAVYPVDCEPSTTAASAARTPLTMSGGRGPCVATHTTLFLWVFRWEIGSTNRAG